MSACHVFNTYNELKSWVVAGKGRNFLGVIVFLNVDWSYLISHWSIAVKCINKFATL